MNKTQVAGQHVSLDQAPPICSGALEALKWIGMITMTLDHFNRFFLNSQSVLAFSLGRLAMPLFAFVFAYNLTRPGLDSEVIFFKYMKRMLLFGMLATPAYIAMRHLTTFWPLNILFTLALAGLLFYLKNQNTPLLFFFAIILFFLGGAFVEYNWAGLLLCIGFGWYCKQQTAGAILTLCLAFFLLNGLNGNYWALLSIPLIVGAAKIELSLPRIPYFFYCYYPFHLTLFWGIRTFFNPS